MVLPKTGPSRPRNWPFSRTPRPQISRSKRALTRPRHETSPRENGTFFLFSFPKPNSLTQATPPLAKQPRTVTSPGHLTLTSTHTHSIKRNNKCKRSQGGSAHGSACYHWERKSLVSHFAVVAGSSKDKRAPKVFGRFRKRNIPHGPLTVPEVLRKASRLKATRA